MAFLTRRLRSAIGEDLVADGNRRETGTAAAEGEEDGRTTDEGEECRSSRHGGQAPAGDAKSDTASGWTWSTLGSTLPTTFTWEEAMSGVSRAFSSTKEQDGRALERAREEGGHRNAEEDSSVGTGGASGYMSALDVRKWFAPRGIARHDAPPSPSSSPAAPVPASPLKGLPTGSFPSSARSRKGKEQGQERPKSSPEGKGNGAERTPGRPEGDALVEHEMEERHVGVPGKEGVERYPDHEFLVLSTAGKPIYASHVSKARLARTAASRERKRERYARREEEQGKRPRMSREEEEEEERLAAEEQRMQDEEDQTVATRVGLVQAVISNYAEAGREKLHVMSREVLALPPTGRICYLLKPPLYLVAIAQWQEAETTLQSHLEYLYLAIVSLLSVSKLHRLFDRAANFDLKRLLQGTDGILDALLTRMQGDSTAMRGTLQPLRLDAALRHDAGIALLPSHNKAHRPHDALYALLLSRKGLVTLARARRHSIHPVDCQLLINTVFATKALKEGGTQSWVPICLPKFAPHGFVYAHVSFLDEEVDDTARTERGARPEVGLVLVTGNPDGFEEMSAWRARVVERLRKDGLLLRLWRHVTSRHDSGEHRGNEPPLAASYSANELGIAGLRHFCFQWRANVQSTSPLFEAPYDEESERHRRILYLYGVAHDDALRRKNEERRSKDSDRSIVTHTSTSSPPSTPPIIPQSVVRRPPQHAAAALRPSMHIVTTSCETILTWTTPPFELALTASPHLPRARLTTMARAIVKWIKQEEHRLFIVSAPVF